MINDNETRAVTLESLGRILELERRVDVLSRVVERERLRRLSDQMDRLDEAYAGEETLIHQDEPSPLDPEKLRDAMEKERQRVKQTSDDLAYQGSARRLRLAARKFINPRGRFEDLRPEINEVLRRKYPATEERLSCPPAPPPSVSAAEETSSGEGRCTAKGAGSCCKDMKFSLEDGYLYRERGYVVMVVEMGAKRRGFIRIDFCPWCGEKLGGEQ